MNDFKLFDKNDKDLETLIKTVRILSEYREGIWHRKMCHTNN